MEAEYRWQTLINLYPDPYKVDYVDAVLEEIDYIDAITPWSELEPSWWLDMMQYRKDLITYQESF